MKWEENIKHHSSRTEALRRIAEALEEIRVLLNAPLAQPTPPAPAKSLIYLATPYSHDDPAVREHRFRVVNAVAAGLMAEGLHIYSPISHTHPIAVEGDLPKGWDFWEKYDRAILAACCHVIVVKQDGWSESKGVRAELEIAKSLGLGVGFIDPPDLAPKAPPAPALTERDLGIAEEMCLLAVARAETDGAKESLDAVKQRFKYLRARLSGAEPGGAEC